MHGWIEEREDSRGKKRYRARWYGMPHAVTGRRSKESSTHSTKAAAQKALRTALSAIDRGEAAARDDRQFRELAELW
jgi:hypothetical protein